MKHLLLLLLLPVLVFPSYASGQVISPDELPWRAAELQDPRRELDALARQAETDGNRPLGLAVALTALATGEDPNRVLERLRFLGPLDVAELRRIYGFLQTEPELRTADDLVKSLGTVHDIPAAWRRFLRARDEGGEDRALFIHGLNEAAKSAPAENVLQALRLLHDPAVSPAELQQFVREEQDHPWRLPAMHDKLREEGRQTLAVLLQSLLPPPGPPEHGSASQPPPDRDNSLAVIRDLYLLSHWLPTGNVPRRTWAEHLVAAADRLPESSDFLVPIAMAYLDLGDLEGVRRMALVAVQESDNRPFHGFAPMTLALLRDALIAHGATDETANPELAALYQRGIAAHRTGDDSSARRFFRLALRQDRELQTLRNLLADLEGRE